MLVIHWARHNKTNSILANGLRPMRRGEIKGVWCYPFMSNQTLVRTWLRNLKTWHNLLGNYNGFVFRLEKDDFPLWAGEWIERQGGGVKEMLVNSPAELHQLYGDCYSVKKAEHLWSMQNFEITVLKHIPPNRIIKVVKDREPIHHVRNFEKHSKWIDDD